MRTVGARGYPGGVPGRPEDGAAVKPIADSTRARPGAAGAPSHLDEPDLDRPVLYGRDAELDSIQALLDGARVGHGGALVVRGEPGIGKSAIVDAVIPRADGFTVLRTLGVEAEHTWSYAGLQM